MLNMTHLGLPPKPYRSTTGAMAHNTLYRGDTPLWIGSDALGPKWPQNMNVGPQNLIFRGHPITLHLFLW